MQQKAPTPTVEDLIFQINSLSLLKTFGSTSVYKFPKDKQEHKISILVFSEASRPSDHGQLGYLSGLLIGDVKSGSVIHTLSWCLHKSRLPVKSIGAAEILAAGEAIDEGKILKKAYSTLLRIDVDLINALDSKDIFTILTTCRNSIDKSIRANVNVIRYEFEMENLNRMIWILGKANMGDTLTKPNSPLSQALQLTMFSGELSISFDTALSKTANMPTG